MNCEWHATTGLLSIVANTVLRSNLASCSDVLSYLLSWPNYLIIIKILQYFACQYKHKKLHFYF